MFLQGPAQAQNLRDTLADINSDIKVRVSIRAGFPYWSPESHLFACAVCVGFLASLSMVEGFCRSPVRTAVLGSRLKGPFSKPGWCLMCVVMVQFVVIS
jgi:hypothetical protein